MPTRCFAQLARSPTLNWMSSSSISLAWARAFRQIHNSQEETPMIVLVDPNDSRAVRNKDNVLALYKLMINQKKSEEATAKFVSPAYIQHNPLIPDGSVALGQFFGKVTRERARARVVVHRIIAVGDYVWAHVNFLNLFNDYSNDTGIAGVDI